MSTPSDATFALVRKVWTYFNEHREWPEKRRMLVELDEHGQDFEQLQHQISGISVQTDEKGVERVQVGFDAVVQLGEGRELFAPLPDLIAALVKRFCDHPDWGDKHDPKTILTFAEIVAVWHGDAESALLAGALMRNHAPAGISPSFDGIATTYSITPGVEALRYRDAKTLDAVLSLHDYRDWTQTGEENRTRFINVVFNQMREQGDWPNPIRAAIDIKGLGFVPHLVAILNGSRPKIIYQHFTHFSNDRIELLLWSLTKLDDANYWKARLPKFVRAMYGAWKASPEGYTPLSAIAKASDLTISDALTLALLTEHEPWASYQMRVQELKPADWNFKGDDKIRYLKDCASWDDYVRLRVEKWQGWPDGFGLPESSEPAGVRTLDDPDETSVTLNALHPRLLEHAGRLARDGYWDDAISKALKGLHQYVASKAGIDPATSGDTLMGRAFNSKSPVLRISEHENEQRGFMLLFQGAFAGLRNPFAHKLVQIDAVQAQEWLGFVSVLYRLVDAATKTPRS